MSATQQQIHAAFSAMRQAIDATGWGSWVPDDKLQPIAAATANAVAAASPRPPAPVPPPAPPASASSKGD